MKYIKLCLTQLWETGSNPDVLFCGYKHRVPFLPQSRKKRKRTLKEPVLRTSNIKKKKNHALKKSTCTFIQSGKGQGLIMQRGRKCYIIRIS